MAEAAPKNLATYQPPRDCNSSGKQDQFSGKQQKQPWREFYNHEENNEARPDYNKMGEGKIRLIAEVDDKDLGG